MKGFILVVVLFFFVWDAAWWLLGVKPLFPWQLKRQLDSGASPAPAGCEDPGGIRLVSLAKGPKCP
jgi:hypothetical protein